MDTGSVIAQYGILPIIKTDDCKKAPHIAAALKRANLPVGEVVFRSPNAHRVLSELRSSYPEMALGAGTILTTAQIDSAKAAGAQYIISPGIDGELVDYSLKNGLLPIPGWIGTALLACASRLWSWSAGPERAVSEKNCFHTGGG